MTNLYRTLLAIFSVALFSITAQGVIVMQPLTTFGTNGDGTVRPGDFYFLTSSNQWQRGMAYNPTTGHLLVVDRSTNTLTDPSANDVYILDGNTGAAITNLDGTPKKLANNNTLSGGNASFTLNLIGIGDDGAIYVANLSNASTPPAYRLYRWENEDAPQVFVFPTASFPDADPSTGNTNTTERRWGDTMTVRGSGLNTEILIANRGTLAAIFTPDDGTYAHFSVKTLTTDVVSGKLGYGLTFGAGNTFWGTSGANGNGPLLHLSYNSGAGTATTLTNISTTRVPGTLTPILVMPSSNLLAGITMVPGADVVRLYDISDTNSPALLDRKSFFTANTNANFSGALALGTNGVLYALDSDNGIIAFRLTNAVSNPLPPVFFLNPASQSAAVGTNVTLTSGADSSLPITYEWRRSGTNFDINATNSFLTFINVQLTDSGSYTVIASTTSESVTSSVAILNVTTNTSGSEIWNLATGGTWDSTGSWNPSSIPDGVGASATFNNAASGLNPAQTANSAVTLDGSKTVGSLNFNNNAVNTFTYNIANGSGGPMVFDEIDDGPATITVNSVAGGTGNNTIVATMSLTDTVVATVNNITASSAAGALNLTGAISGPGGFTKLGDGLATFGTGAKSYTGPTVLGGGRMRISVAARPSATSSFTINAGGQLTQITAGSLAVGSGPVNLNGAGPTTGPFAAFPGAIRNDTSLVASIPNSVVLQSDTLIHVEGSATGSLTLGGAVSGPGKLTLTAPTSSANQGQLVLNGNNTYQGGTLVRGGTLVISGESASLGTGGVTVDNSTSPSSIAKLTIQAGVTNAISDTATLSLAGGGTAGVADQGFADLGAGVNETVGGLSLGGASQGAGTYGSTSSSATFQSDEYFSGSGIVTVVPPPVPPSLKIVLSLPNAIISWPTSATGFILEGTTNLNSPIIWATVPNPVIVSGTNNTVTVSAGSGNKYFRLKK